MNVHAEIHWETCLRAFCGRVPSVSLIRNRSFLIYLLSVEEAISTLPYRLAESAKPWINASLNHGDKPNLFQNKTRAKLTDAEIAEIPPDLPYSGDKLLPGESTTGGGGRVCWATLLLHRSGPFSAGRFTRSGPFSTGNVHPKRSALHRNGPLRVILLGSRPDDIHVRPTTRTFNASVGEGRDALTSPRLRFRDTSRACRQQRPRSHVDCNTDDRVCASGPRVVHVGRASSACSDRDPAERVGGATGAHPPRLDGQVNLFSHHTWAFDRKPTLQCS